jgi:Mn-dependent DtxR family transcriptional regulator
LTEKGLAKAQDIYGRHKLLTKFLMMITKLPEDQCEENACRVEHDVDVDVVNGIRAWVEANSAE